MSKKIEILRLFDLSASKLFHAHELKFGELVLAFNLLKLLGENGLENNTVSLGAQ